MARFQGLFFLEKWILRKSSILKRFIFVVPEYNNLTCAKIHRDRLKSSREGFLERGVQIFGFGKGKGPHRGFGCCLVVAFHSSVCSIHEFSKKKFCFCSRLPFRVFTLESFFIFFIFIFYHFSIVLLCTQKFIPNRWMVYQEFWLKKRDNSLVDYEKFLKEENSSVQVSTFNQNGLFRYVM